MQIIIQWPTGYYFDYFVEVTVKIRRSFYILSAWLYFPSWPVGHNRDTETEL